MNIAKETKTHMFRNFLQEQKFINQFSTSLDSKVVWTVSSLTWTNCRSLQASWDLAFLFSLPKFFLEVPQLSFLLANKPFLSSLFLPPKALDRTRSSLLFPTDPLVGNFKFCIMLIVFLSKLLEDKSSHSYWTSTFQGNVLGLTIHIHRKQKKYCFSN